MCPQQFSLYSCWCFDLLIKQNEYVCKLPLTPLMRSNRERERVRERPSQKFTELYKSFHRQIKLTLLRYFMLWSLKALFLSEGQTRKCRKIVSPDGEEQLTTSLGASLNIQSKRTAVGKKPNSPIALRTCDRSRLRNCRRSTAKH